MDWRDEFHTLLHEIGLGKMPSTAYDTAWVARFGPCGEPLGEEALEWVRAQQLPDGSWGAPEPRYYHDRLICTLAAITALAQTGSPRDRERCDRALSMLELASKSLMADPAGETIGFEMIAPILLSEAKSLGAICGRADENFRRLSNYRAAKLAALPDGVINRNVTVAFSAEMAGPDGLNLLQVDDLQEANGSVAYSPSATAYFALSVRPQDPAALGYLNRVATGGGVPDVAPFDVFERAWTLWNLALAGPLDDEMQQSCQVHVASLEQAWEPGRGAGFASGYSPKDGDETSVVHEVLTRFGWQGDLQAVLQFEEDEYFRCYALEANPSLSTNIHVLSALRQAGYGRQHPSVQKILRFLRRTQTLRLFWLDKWHASPYYPTSHAIISGVGYDDDLLDNAIYWIEATQNSDGSWGYYSPTAEETAYCLQALCCWKRSGHYVPREVLKRGAGWLAEHAELPYAPLWIGKCLYCPELVVRSAVLSALALVQEEA